MPDVGVARGTCTELELDHIGHRVLILITVNTGNMCVAGGVVRDPEERDTYKDRVCFVGCGLNGKRVGSIIPVDLVHGLIVVHRDVSHGSLHFLEEIVVQARCAVVLFDDNSDNAVRGQFPGRT